MSLGLPRDQSAASGWSDVSATFHGTKRMRFALRPATRDDAESRQGMGTSKMGALGLLRLERHSMYHSNFDCANAMRGGALAIPRSTRRQPHGSEPSRRCPALFPSPLLVYLGRDPPAWAAVTSGWRVTPTWEKLPHGNRGRPDTNWGSGCELHTPQMAKSQCDMQRDVAGGYTRGRVPLMGPKRPTMC